MNKTTGIFWRNLLLTAAVWLAAGFNAAHGEAPAPASPLPATTPPEIIKPAPPGELKSADAVFDELDVGRRGYVTRQDTEDLIGFGEAFRAVDTQGSGRLTRAQFAKAWKLYQAGKP